MCKMIFRAAVDFICKSRYDTFLTANQVSRGNMVDENRGGNHELPLEGSKFPCLITAPASRKSGFTIDVNPCHVREVSKALSSKVSKYVAAMMCAKRDSKQRAMAEVILQGLCDLTGEETTMDDPKTRLHKILALTSDRIALWLAQNMDDGDIKRAKKRKREDRILKRKILAREKERTRRQKEKDRLTRQNGRRRKSPKNEDRLSKENKNELGNAQKEDRSNKNRYNEPRTAQKEAGKDSKGQAEKMQKKEEREKRHQEMEKFREEQKRKQKDETTTKNTKEGSGAAKSKAALREPSKTVQSGNKKSRVDGISTSKQAKKPPLGSAQPAKTGVTRTEVNAPPYVAGISPAVEKPETGGQQSGDAETTSNTNQKPVLTTIQPSASKVDDGREKPIKNVSLAYMASSDKLTLSQSKANSLAKLVDILSQGQSSTALTSQDKLATAGLLRVVSLHDGLPKAVHSQGVHSNLGAKSSSPGGLGTTKSQRLSESLLTVKKISRGTVEVHKTSYSEAKQKIRAVKREAGTLPPNVPFDPNDPQSWKPWVHYATQLVEDWGHWVDKTIQDTEDKAILYRAKAKEGKIGSDHVLDWNQFVEKTNADAQRWRRKMRNTIFETGKDRKHH